MADTDTTAGAVAAEPSAQPTASSAVAEPTAVPTTPEGQSPAVDTTAQPTAPARLWAGKYKTPEEMERGYADSTSEAMRLYQENQKLQSGRTSPAATPQTETYTAEQLTQYREHWARKAVDAQASGDAAAAADAMLKVNQCNDKLIDVRLTQERERWQGQTAVQSLVQDGTELIKPFAEDLQPGKPLYDQARQYYDQINTALRSGQSLDQIISTMAVLTAAAKTGKATAGVASKARAEFADSVNQAMRQAVVTGGGQASKPTTNRPDFDSMTPAQFKEYQKSTLGLRV